MAIVSFFSNEKGQIGKTSSIIAISTLLAIVHNYRILILDTKFNDHTLEDAYWEENKTLKLINSKSNKTDVGSGLSGLAKAVMSNKTSPEIITNYAKLIFNKSRLELLTDTNVEEEEYEKHKTLFKQIAQIANKYYDLVFIDLSNDLDDEVNREILEASNLIVMTLSQKKRVLDDYRKLKETDSLFSKENVVTLLSRYDRASKYNAKNIGRYLGEKTEVTAIPYNTLFFEACNEGQVSDFFIKNRRVTERDNNGRFFTSIRKSTEIIVKKIQELQTRM